jgi:transcriptional regulator GlxA family with amidase domain
LAAVAAPAFPADGDVTAGAIDAEDLVVAEQDFAVMAWAVDAEHDSILRAGRAADEWQNCAYPQDFCHDVGMAVSSLVERSRPRRRETRPHVVAGLVGRRVAAFELGVVHEVFGLDRSEYFAPGYDLRVIGAFGSPIEVNNGNWQVTTPWRLDDLADADTVVVATWADFHLPSPPEVLDAVRAVHQRGGRVLSVCSGAFLLAETGLLDGRRATTHWAYAAELAGRYPDVDVDPNVLFVDAGDGIYTSAGTAAGIDLCLHIVRLDYGAEAANAIARRMVVPPQRDGGQAQFADAPMPLLPHEDRLAETLEWAIAHLDQPLRVEDLARRALSSPRTFARRFRAVTGTTPMQWLTRQRVIHAQRLLETTDLPIELVAQRCGLGTGTALRQHFRRLAGTSPQAYRRTFRCEEAS